MLKQYGCLKLVHFSKKSGRLPSAGSGILTCSSHCSANFQPILDCSIPKCKFKLEYDDSEIIKTDRVNTVVFNLHQIKRLKVFIRHPIGLKTYLVQLCQFYRIDLIRDEPFNIYRGGGGGGTSFEMMHAIFFKGPLYAKQFFFSDVNVSKQFFSWKIFGMSSWDILVVKDIMCNRPWVIDIDSWRVGGSTRSLWKTAFYFSL